MILHGGFNEENKFLGDTRVLSLSPLKWTQVNICEFTAGPFLARLACALALPLEIKSNVKTNLYRFSDNPFGKPVSTRVIFLYFF